MPHRAPQPRAIQTGREAQVTPGRRNQRILSPCEPGTASPSEAALVAGEAAQLCLGPAQGSVAAPSSDFKGPSTFWKGTGKSSISN